MAQVNESYKPSKIILPSPTAASLGKYGDISVGYYSGTPDINIPLYNLVTKNHSIPITMRYNNTGTRVTEIASWVGLGWSLSAGGVITRSIIGLDDFGNNGFYNSTALPPPNNPPSINDFNYFNDILLGNKDGEPDIFSYNFGKYSGKFVIGKKIDGSPIIMDDRNNLKITYNESSQKWIVVTPDGYKYYLGTHERVEDYNFNSELIEASDSEPLSNFTRNINSFPITSWYLDSIVAPNSEVVKFKYLIKSNSLGLINKSEAYFRLLELNGGCWNNTVEVPAVKKTYSASRQVIYDVYLTAILSDQGSIEFNTSDRNDVEYVNINKPKKLSEIVVKNSNGETLRRFDFSYDYFIGAKLKLNSITEIGKTGISKPPYHFKYYSNDVPELYLQKSIDHWGYYNGASNTSLLPSAVFPSSTIPFNFKSADKKSTINADLIKKGVLRSITYPTGDSTVFDFEMNEYSNLTGEDRYDYIGKSASVYNYPPFIPNTSNKYSETFTITQDSTPVSLVYNYIKADENANSLEGYQSTYGNLRKVGVTSPLLDFEVWNCSSYSPVYCTPGPHEVTLFLNRGTYILSIGTLQGYITRANAFWEEKVAVTQRKAAGLRIKTIKNYSHNVNVDTRKFIYSDAGKTTGVLITQPKYDFRTNFIADAATDGCSISAKYMALMSNSTTTIGLLTGTIIGYNKVTELFGENGENGKNEYFFMNSESSAGAFPFIPVSQSPLNGKLSKSISYRANGAILKKIDYLYEIKESQYLSGVKIYQPPVTSSFSNPVVNFSFYSNHSNWVVQSKEVEMLFDSIPITRSKEHFFNNASHKELTTELLRTSSGEFKVTNYIYPHDIIPITALSQKLIDDGKIGTILEQSVRKGVNSITSKNNFSFNWLPLILIETVSTTNSSDNNEEIRLRYQNYDEKGNVLSSSQEGGSKTCYVWGYRGQYPIAKIENADYSLISSVLGGSANVNRFRDIFSPTDDEVLTFLSILRTDPRFVNTLVTTFTYKPLEGITSITDPKGLTTYYKYDDFQRLMFIEDQHKNIVKSFDYHFKL